MKEDTVPDKLYKYFPEKDYVFPTPTLRYSPPDLLNDAEECIPSLDNNFPLDFLAETARMAGLVWSAAELGSLAADLQKDDPEMTRRRFADLHKKTNLGILCLASDPFDQAMWGHYASSHRGVVLELDMNHFCFGPMKGFSKFRPVRYTDKRPSGNISSPEEMLSLYFTKSLYWENEKEYRRITEIADQLNACPGVPGTIHLPPDAITAIYLGLNTEGEFQKRAMDFCRKNGIPCGRVCRDPIGYKLHRPDLEIPESES